MSSIYLDYHLLDKRDNRTGRNLCRCCRAVVPKGRKKFYCSDECRKKVYWKYEWGYVRHRVIKRDNFKCQFVMVNKKLGIREVCNYESREITHSGLEVHHIVPVSSMWRLIRDMRNEGLIRKEDGALAFMNMYVETSNLITYCREHHDVVHRNLFRKHRERRITMNDYFKKYMRGYTDIENSRLVRFWKNNELDRLQKRLSFFF